MKVPFFYLLHLLRLRIKEAIKKIEVKKSLTSLPLPSPKKTGGNHLLWLKINCFVDLLIELFVYYAETQDFLQYFVPYSNRLWGFLVLVNDVDSTGFPCRRSAFVVSCLPPVRNIMGLIPSQKLEKWYLLLLG